MIYFFENLHFILTISFIYIITSFSSGFLPHLLLYGLEFCVPPTDEYIEELIKDPPRKKSKKKQNTVEIHQESVILQLAQISSPCLQDHFFFSEFDFLLDYFVRICCIIIFYEIWAFISPLLFINDSKSSLRNSSVEFIILLLGIGYCLKLLFSVIKQAGSESYEMRFSLLLGICSSILCFFILEIPEDILNFGLRSGFHELLRQCHDNYPNFPTSIINFTMFRSILSIFSGYIAGITVYPGLRLARCHYLLLRTKADTILAKINFILSIIGFVLPILCIISWVTPLTRDVIVNENNYDSKGITSEMYDNYRILLFLLFCFLRLYLVRTYIQTYLNTSLSFAELFIGCTQKRTLISIRDRMYGIYAYLCVACVQLVTPIILLFFLILEVKSEGVLSLELFSTYDNEAAKLFPPLFIKGIFSFISWWFITWWFIISVIGFMYEKTRQQNTLVMRY